MWLKVGMPLHVYIALITDKRVVLIMYEAPIFKRTFKRQIRPFWLCMSAPLNIKCGRVPAETDSARQHGSYEMILTRDSVILS